MNNKRAQRALSVIILAPSLILLIFTAGVRLLNRSPVYAETTVVVNEPTPTPILNKPQKKEPKEIPWYLLLVNTDNPIPEGYAPTLAKVDGNHQVDERIADVLSSMLKACRNQGLNPMICSSYRSNEEQDKLFQAKLRKNKTQSMSYEDAFYVTKTVVAYPGTSEHQIGLAVDIVSVKNQVLSKNQEKTEVYKWLKKHCAEYGFIVRYPDGKADITGIIYEPWHFRYVGVEAATEIMSRKITLEEYLQGYK